MYRIYGNKIKGYEIINIVSTVEEIFKTLDPIVLEETYNKYLIIKNENNTDAVIGTFYTYDNYINFKEQMIKPKQKVLIKGCKKGN